MNAYFKGLETLLIQADIHEHEEATVARFVVGLNSKITEVVELQHYVELQDLVEKAEKMECQLKVRKGHGMANNSNQFSWWEEHERRDEWNKSKLKERESRTPITRVRSNLL